MMFLAGFDGLGAFPRGVENDAEFRLWLSKAAFGEGSWGGLAAPGLPNDRVRPPTSDRFPKDPAIREAQEKWISEKLNPWLSATPRTRRDLCVFLKPVRRWAQNGTAYYIYKNLPSPFTDGWIIGTADGQCYVKYAPFDTAAEGLIWNAIEGYFRGKTLTPARGQQAIAEIIAELQQGVLDGRWVSRTEWINDPKNKHKAFLKWARTDSDFGGGGGGYSGASIAKNFGKSAGEAVAQFWASVPKGGGGDGTGIGTAGLGIGVGLLLGAAVLGGIWYYTKQKKPSRSSRRKR